MQKTIKELTDTELKAIAFDNLASIEQAQANIKAINQELQARREEIQTSTPKQEKKK